MALWHIQCPGTVPKWIETILEGLEGSVCHMDDVLVFNADQAEHNSRLERVLLAYRRRKLPSTQVMYV